MYLFHYKYGYKLYNFVGFFLTTPQKVNMNVLTTVMDGDTILKVNGTFGKSKTVTVNNFGGMTYIHLKSPKKDATGWKTFTLSLVEYRELVRMAGPTTVAAIAHNFDIQVCTGDLAALQRY